ncbi:S1C family serine protease [Candidatus Pelagibacter sp. HIMB1782]|uniref:S1C family serine protease n=1 Tax=Candidatus Pelagibacter sp. HIMB1782 TaxID=3413375 RepID=UPI003F82C0F2
MKKLLSIVVLLTLIFGGVSNSSIIELNRCVPGQNNFPEFKKADWKSLNYNKRNVILYKFHAQPKKDQHGQWKLVDERSSGELAGNEKYIKELVNDGYKKLTFLEKHLYSINTNNAIVTHVYTYSDEYWKYKQEYISRFKRLEPNRLKNEYTKAMYRSFYLTKKTRVEKYNIVDFFDNKIIAEKKGQSDIYPDGKQSILIDLEKLTVTSNLKKNLFDDFQMFFKVCTTDEDSGGSSGGSSGTAFFVSNKGHLLTNNHVVDGCEVSKITYKDKDYNTRLLATDKTLDLALLKAEIKPKSFINFSKDDAKKLNKIYVAGYPLGKGLSDDLKISSGIVSSLKGFEDNSNELQIDAPINPGNSGGPIINENGSLVAIAVSGLAKDKTEGINFGIKSSAAQNFLKSNNLNPKISMYSGIQENDKLLEILEEGTVYTYCN